MIRKFELCALRLVGFGSAKENTLGAPEGDDLEDKVSFFPI